MTLRHTKALRKNAALLPSPCRTLRFPARLLWDGNAVLFRRKQGLGSAAQRFDPVEADGAHRLLEDVPAGHRAARLDHEPVGDHPTAATPAPRLVPFLGATAASARPSLLLPRARFPATH